MQELPCSVEGCTTGGDLSRPWKNPGVSGWGLGWVRQRGRQRQGRQGLLKGEPVRASQRGATSGVWWSHDATVPAPSLACDTRRGILSLALAAFCTLWSADTAGKIIVRRTPALEGMQRLVMLPCLLLYSAFTFLCIY